MTTQETTTYAYARNGQLNSVTLPDDTVIEYVHNAAGQRVAKKVNGVITEKYLWAGITGLLAVYDGSNNLVMRFEGAKMVKNGQTYYLITDQVGTVRAVVDATGTIVKEITYDSFGNILTDSNPSFTIPLGFANGLHDRDTGLVRFGFRDYDPDSGTWTAKDPILFGGGDIDLYGYCLANPVNLNDPEGLDWLDDAASLSAGFGDVVSFNLTSLIRRGMGTDDFVDRSSGWYKSGKIAGVAHGLATGGGGILKGGYQSLRTLFYDPRRFGSISRAFWRGTATGRANGLALHHWLIPQRWTRVPAAIRNAGWNTVVISGRFNRWMGFAPRWGGIQGAAARVAENTMRFSIAGSAAAPVTAKAKCVY